MRARRCRFCGKGDALTREHLWATWVSNALAESGLHNFPTRRQEPDGTETRWRQPKLELKAKLVCESCNNGWMSKLENAVKPIIIDMVVHRSPAALGTNEVREIAKYAVLKCMLADFMQDTRPPFFSFMDSRRFMETLVPPDGFQMWLATSSFRRGLFLINYFTTSLGTPKGFEMNSFTYAIGYLVIQASTVRYRKKALRKYGRAPMLNQSGDWNTYSVPAWPTGEGTQIHWPPPSQLNAQVAEVFVNRWDSVNRRDL